MANVSYDCQDGDHRECNGATWDTAGKFPFVTTCDCVCHTEATRLAAEDNAKFWANEENREMLRQAFLSSRIAGENEQARQDSLGD